MANVVPTRSKLGAQIATEWEYLASVTHRGSAQAWQLTSANAITRLADVTLSRNSIVTTLPAQSVTLFVVPSNGTAAPPRAPTNVRIVGGGH